MKPILPGIIVASALLIGCDQGTTGPDNTKASTNAGAAGETYSTEKSPPASKPADNTGINVRDRKDMTLTPTDQSEKESDRELTRSIRRAISTNDTLSASAKNIKIISIGGTVTLRGPVRSEEEKRLIDSIATQAGASSVSNQLEPTPQNQ